MSSASSDSDADSFDTAPSSVNETPGPPKDPALSYGHLVKDPVVVGPITEKSTIAELYRFDDGKFAHRNLLKELSTFSTPIPARIRIGNVGFDTAPIYVQPNLFGDTMDTNSGYSWWTDSQRRRYE
ncbi:unnamed protein product [Cercospora beticola]|nr:unnamed protein product [Cercospora beticola]